MKKVELFQEIVLIYLYISLGIYEPPIDTDLAGKRAIYSTDAEHAG